MEKLVFAALLTASVLAAPLAGAQYVKINDEYIDVDPRVAEYIQELEIYRQTRIEYTSTPAGEHPLVIKRKGRTLEIIDLTQSSGFAKVKIKVSHRGTVNCVAYNTGGVAVAEQDWPVQSQHEEVLIAINSSQIGSASCSYK